MTNTVKKFIEENIDLIEQNDFSLLFSKAFHLNVEQIGELSKVLEDAHVYPLNYLSYVPAYYMCGTDISTFAPKAGITYIGQGAFRYCDNLISVDLPEGLEQINPHAFEDCSNIRELNLPKSLKYIHSTAFLDSLNHPELLAHAPYPSYANYWLNNHIYS